MKTNEEEEEDEKEKDKQRAKLDASNGPAESAPNRENRTKTDEFCEKSKRKTSDSRRKGRVYSKAPREDDVSKNERDDSRSSRRFKNPDSTRATDPRGFVETFPLTPSNDRSPGYCQDDDGITARNCVAYGSRPRNDADERRNRARHANSKANDGSTYTNTFQSDSEVEGQNPVTDQPRKTKPKETRAAKKKRVRARGICCASIDIMFGCIGLPAFFVGCIPLWLGLSAMICLCKYTPDVKRGICLAKVGMGTVVLVVLGVLAIEVVFIVFITSPYNMWPKWD